MKEKLYTIPVNDAFGTECECPVCAMKHILEQNAVEYTMGPSYMEDDVRMETDQMGFCEKHMHMVWDQNNKLGLALVVKTHMEKIIRDIGKMEQVQAKPKGLFKKSEENPVVSYLRHLEKSCFVCDRIEKSFERYIVTIFYLWKSDTDFRKKYESSKGFCNEHYAKFLEDAPKHLNGKNLAEFLDVTNRIYMENMQRVTGDVEWFINKFDYRYQDEPWKNAKDSLQRALIKLNGIMMEEEKRKPEQ